MNALDTLIGVMQMQLVTTLKGVTPALATVDSQGMDSPAVVSDVSIAYLIILLF